MGKAPCCEKDGLKKGPWTPEEDKKLLDYIEQHGHDNWRALPAKAGLRRCGKSCRLRWRNYLRPDIKRGKFSHQEEQTIIQLHALLGNRWSAIAALVPKRTDNEIKNYWNTRLKKRLMKMGIDPVTHKPKSNALASGQSKETANLINHIAQWESARVEAEARLVRDSKLLSSKYPYEVPMIPPLSTKVGNLVSSTSSLLFSDNMFTVPASAGFGNDKIEEGMLLQKVESFAVDAMACVGDQPLGVPSFRESFTGDPRWDVDAELFNINGHYDNYINLGSIWSGNLEDDMKFWNTTLINGSRTSNNLTH